jgi:hypothetical protein
MTVNTQGKEQILIEDLQARVKKLKLEIRGFAGGTVYRKSHEDVSKELDALRRYAKNLLEVSDE